MRKSDGLYNGKSSALLTHVGVTVACDPVGEVSPERTRELEDISEELRGRMLLAVADLVSGRNDLTQSEKTFVVFDAGTAVCADWYCRADMVANTTMHMRDAMNLAKELLQGNFADRQSELYKRMGGWVH